ncbi:hypothetical protein [Streptomyces sp. NBC_01276]|uniref:hypothetical protein n=1 Tax=Streptomyces sp. NBC_01276 TaxID=2903808 RepID=UPI00352D25F6
MRPPAAEPRERCVKKGSRDEMDRLRGRLEALVPAYEAGAALVVREPSVVHFMTAAFERSWLGAQPFATTVSPDAARSISDELRQTTTARAGPRDRRTGPVTAAARSRAPPGRRRLRFRAGHLPPSRGPVRRRTRC